MKENLSPERDESSKPVVPCQKSMIYGPGTFVLNLLAVHCLGRRNPFWFHLMQAYQREILWLKVGGKDNSGKDVLRRNSKNIRVIQTAKSETLLWA